MALEEQLATLIEVNLEIRDLLKGGAGASVATETKPTGTRGKRGATKATETQKNDDLDDDLSSKSGSDELDDDLNDDDGLGGDEPTITPDQVKDALMEVKSKVSKEKALEIMKKVGKSASVGGIQPEHFDAVIKATTAALKAAK